MIYSSSNSYRKIQALNGSPHGAVTPIWRNPGQDREVARGRRYSGRPMVSVRRGSPPAPGKTRWRVLREGCEELSRGWVQRTVAVRHAGSGPPVGRRHGRVRIVRRRYQRSTYVSTVSTISKRNRARFTVSSILVDPEVSRAIQKLGNEIKVVRLDLNAVKPGFQRVLRRRSKIKHSLTNLRLVHRTRRDRRFPSRGRNAFLFRIHGRSGHGQSAVKEVGVRHSAGVPELGIHQAALFVKALPLRGAILELARGSRGREYQPNRKRSG